MIIQFTDISAKNFAVYLIFPDLVNQLIVCLMKILVLDNNYITNYINTIKYPKTILYLHNYTWSNIAYRKRLFIIWVSKNWIVIAATALLTFFIYYSP